MQRRLPLRLVLAAALSATAFGLAAQPVDPAATPVVETVPVDPVDPVDPAAEVAAEPTVAEEAADRRCLRHTGSRLTRTAKPETDAQGRPEQEPTRCAIAPGTAYTREDLKRSGHPDVASALRALDPRVY